MDFGKDEEWNWQRRVLKKPATTSAQTVTGLRFQHGAGGYEAGVPLPAWWGCPVRNFMNFILYICIHVWYCYNNWDQNVQVVHSRRMRWST